jgi:hypothetical protein
LVNLTGEGRATLEAIQATQRPWANALEAAIGERELRRANTVLDRVLERGDLRPMLGERSTERLRIGHLLLDALGEPPPW